MPAPAVLAFLLVLAAPIDTARLVARDSAFGPVMGSLAVGAIAPDDTVQRRRKSVEVSEWYERRLRLHRYGSYTIYPLFALQAVAGNQIFPDPQNAPTWARNSHRSGASALSGVFTLNTVTGLWNLWDSRHDPEGRTRRIIHSALFIVADAGFAYAGSIGREGREDGEDRSRHRTVALSSMGVSTLGWVIMLFRN